MNGPQHWREADQILTKDDRCSYGCPHTGCPHEMAMIGRAIAHAIQALTVATVGRGGFTLADRHEWQTVIDPEYAAEQDATPARPTGGTT